MVTWVTVLFSVAISATTADNTKVTTTEATKPNIPILVKLQDVYRITSQSQDSLSKIIPHVTFDCHLRTEGYYADGTFNCKVFHYCKQDGKIFTFACPPESSFNQKLLTCDYQAAGPCAQSEKHIHLNEHIYSKQNTTSQEDIVFLTTNSQKETISKPPAKYDNPPVTPPLRIQDLDKTEVPPNLIDSSLHPPSSISPTTHLNSVINSLKDPFLIQGSDVEGRKHQKDVLSLSRAPISEEHVLKALNYRIDPNKVFLYQTKSNSTENRKDLPDGQPEDLYTDYGRTENIGPHYQIIWDDGYPQYTAQKYYNSREEHSTDKNTRNILRENENSQYNMHDSSRQVDNSKLNVNIPLHATSALKHNTNQNKSTAPNHYGHVVLPDLDGNIHNGLSSIPGRLTTSVQSSQNADVHFLRPNQRSYLATNNQYISHPKPAKHFSQILPPVTNHRQNSRVSSIRAGLTKRKNNFDQPITGLTGVRYTQISFLPHLRHHLRHYNEPNILYNAKVNEILEQPRFFANEPLIHPDQQEYYAKFSKTPKLFSVEKTLIPNTLFHPLQKKYETSQSHQQKRLFPFAATNLFSRFVYFAPLKISRMPYLKKRNDIHNRRKRVVPNVTGVNIPPIFHQLQVKTSGGAQQDRTRSIRRRRQLLNSQSTNSKEPDVFIRPLSSEESLFPYQKPLLRDSRNGKGKQILQKSISRAHPSLKDTFELRYLEHFEREPRQFPIRNPSQQPYSDTQNQSNLQPFLSFRQTSVPNQFSKSKEVGDYESESEKSDSQDTVSHSVRRPYSQRHIVPFFEYGSKPYSGFQPSPFTLSQRPFSNLDKDILQQPLSTEQQNFPDPHQQVSSYGFVKPDSPLHLNDFQPRPPPRFVSTNSNHPFLVHSEFFQDPAWVPPSRYLQDNARQRPDQNVRNGHVPQRHLHESFELVNNKKIPGPNFRDPNHSKKPPFEKKRQEYDFFEPNNPKKTSLADRRLPGAILLNNKRIRPDPGSIGTEAFSKHPPGRELLGRLTPNSEIRRPAKEFGGRNVPPRNAARKKHRESFLGNSKGQRIEYDFDKSQRNPLIAHVSVEPPGNVFKLNRHIRPNEDLYRKNIFRRPRLHKEFSEPILNQDRRVLRKPLQGKITEDSGRLKPKGHFNHQRHVQSHTTERNNRKKYGPDSEAYKLDQSFIKYKSHQLVERPKKSSSTPSLIRDPFFPEPTRPSESPFLSQEEDENIKIPFGVRIETVDKYSENKQPLTQRPRQKLNIQTEYFSEKNSQSPDISRQHPWNSSRYNAGRKIPSKTNYGKRIRPKNIHKNQPISQRPSEILQNPSTRLYETQSGNQNLPHPVVQKTKAFPSAVQEKNNSGRETFISGRTHDDDAENEPSHPLSKTLYRSNKKDELNNPSQPLGQTLNSPRRPHGKPLITELKDSSSLFINSNDDHQESMYPPSLSPVPRHLPLPHQKIPSQFTSTTIFSTTSPRHSVPSNNFEKNIETDSHLQIEKDIEESVRIKSPLFRSDSFINGRRRPSFARRFRRPRHRFRGRKKRRKTKVETEEIGKTETSFNVKQPFFQTKSENLKENHESTTTNEPEIKNLSSSSKHKKVKSFRRLNDRLQEAQTSTNPTIPLSEVKEITKSKDVSSTKTDSNVSSTDKSEYFVEVSTISQPLTTLIPRRVFSSRIGGSLSSTLSRFKKRPQLLSFGRPRFDTEVSDQPPARELSTKEAPL